MARRAETSNSGDDRAGAEASSGKDTKSLMVLVACAAMLICLLGCVGNWMANRRRRRVEQIGAGAAFLMPGSTVMVKVL